jgi:hypothetical protein
VVTNLLDTIDDLLMSTRLADTLTTVANRAGALLEVRHG